MPHVLCTGLLIENAARTFYFSLPLVELFITQWNIFSMEED